MHHHAKWPNIWLNRYIWFASVTQYKILFDNRHRRVEHGEANARAKMPTEIEGLLRNTFSNIEPNEIFAIAIKENYLHIFN